MQAEGRQLLLDPQAAAPAALGASIPAPSDQHFAEELGLISAFDFDYDNIIGFQTKLKWAQFVFTPALWVSSICCLPCFINQNVEWEARAQHVALTVDGIRYVKTQRKTLCGLSCTDKGKESKTVPYDKITDCDVQEPAGTACCCCIQRTLPVVTVDTASSGGRNGDGVRMHELTLSGLRYPLEFKQAVWSMKRGQAMQEHAAAETSPQQQMTMNSVLLEIRDELRRMNAQTAAPPAPLNGTHE